MRVSGYVQRLLRAGVVNAGQEAVWLAAYALGADTAGVLSRGEFPPEDLAKIEAVISRREDGEPLQYILGEADFYGRDFRVGRGVLIPRHDTETLIEAVKLCFGREELFTFLDWGTGSGCIAATILLEFPESSGYVAEASDEAKYYALSNFERWGVSGRVTWCEGFPACGLTISNPPYIPSGEIGGLMREVREFEPVTALDGGQDGMKFCRDIFSRSRSDCIILEAGNVQALKTLSSDYVFVNEVRDSGGFPRALIFRRRNDYDSQKG